MAHTKSSGAAKYGRDSRPKFLGIKKSADEKVKVGEILVRQRGSKYLVGKGVKRGSDDTLFALCEGIVKFVDRRRRRFDGTLRNAKEVQVISK